MTPVAIGAVAPDFALRDQHGATFRLSEELGVRSVAVVFFPYAFSGVCTEELSTLQRRLEDVVSATAAVVAVSCDPVHSLRAFADRDGLTFALLSDFWPHGAVARAYGVLDETRGCPRRSTFVIGPEGSVRWSVHNEPGRPRDLDDLVAAMVDRGS